MDAFKWLVNVLSISILNALRLYFIDTRREKRNYWNWFENDVDIIEWENSIEFRSKRISRGDLPIVNDRINLVHVEGYSLSAQKHVESLLVPHKWQIEFSDIHTFYGNKQLTYALYRLSVISHFSHVSAEDISKPFEPERKQIKINFISLFCDRYYIALSHFFSTNKLEILMIPRSDI